MGDEFLIPLGSVGIGFRYHMSSRPLMSALGCRGERLGRKTRGIWVTLSTILLLAVLKAHFGARERHLSGAVDVDLVHGRVSTRKSTWPRRDTSSICSRRWEIAWEALRLKGGNGGMTSGWAGEEHGEEELRETFDGIYRRRMWGNEGDGSGLGSEPHYTLHTRRLIADLVMRYNVSSMVDAPCGALKWTQILIRELQANNKDFRYRGIDIAPSVVNSNRVRFRRSEPIWEFECGDLACIRIPTGFDVIFTRDCLQHLPYHTIWKIIENVARSPARYWLVGSYDGARNRNISPGDYFPINIRAGPFNLANPIEVLDERTADGKMLLLYDIQTTLRPLFTNACAVAS